MMECSSCARLCNRGLLPQSRAPDLWDRRLVSTAHLSEGHRSTAQGMHEGGLCTVFDMSVLGAELILCSSVLTRGEGTKVQSST